MQLVRSVLLLGTGHYPAVVFLTVPAGPANIKLLQQLRPKTRLSFTKVHKLATAVAFFPIAAVWADRLRVFEEIRHALFTEHLLALRASYRLGRHILAKEAGKALEE